MLGASSRHETLRVQNKKRRSHGKKNEIPGAAQNFGGRVTETRGKETSQDCFLKKNRNFLKKVNWEKAGKSVTVKGKGWLKAV